MKQDLVATFTNGLEKKHDWTYKNLKKDLPIPVIKEACNLLTSLDIFEENGIKLFDKVVTAKIVTIKETEIFDTEKETKTNDYRNVEPSAAKAEAPLKKIEEASLKSTEALKNEQLMQHSFTPVPKIKTPQMTVVNKQSDENPPPVRITRDSLLPSLKPMETIKGLVSWIRNRTKNEEEAQKGHDSS